MRRPVFKSQQHPHHHPTKQQGCSKALQSANQEATQSGDGGSIRPVGELSEKTFNKELSEKGNPYI